MRRYGWKQTHADGVTRNSFVWPLVVGAEVSSCDQLNPDNRGVCPTRPGDGLSVGLTARGVAAGAIRSSTMLVVSWDDADTVGEDADKVRVAGPVRVELLLDRDRMLREHGRGANLRDADLRGADLRGADLWAAGLRGADLWDADLRGADLRDANLGGADLGDANLGGANLGYANLGGANLGGADLRGANLRGADLGGANLGEWERGPNGHARRKTEVPS